MAKRNTKTGDGSSGNPNPGAGSQNQEGSSGTGGGLISAVVRVFSILETLSTKKSINLEHLSQETGLAKPTVYRFLNTLRGLGYVHRDENDQYFPTLKMFSIGSRILDHMDLPSITRPIAQGLSDRLGETVHLGVREGDEAIYLVKIESKYTLRMYSQVGKKIPLYCTAIGKSLLAGQASGEVDAYLERTRLIPFTPHTITDARAFHQELDRVRDQHSSQDREEHEEGIRCIASPILDHRGSTVAAMSVSWPVFRFDNAREAEYVGLVRDATKEISRILGAQI